ncbi:hypothetical protein E2C01_047961 [Portunus trituberculatus]|uniref:Uncharacterized protein n=1 Tax=Portunus trituberculatus TaxID=210409 RepID=A0A5B7G999_PORTR|nr:hypothetical protein [Portunus trituberculatus]
MKPCYCPEVGFTRSHSTQPELLSHLLAFWSQVEIQDSTSEHNASWDYRGITQHFPTATPHKSLNMHHNIMLNFRCHGIQMAKDLTALSDAYIII